MLKKAITIKNPKKLKRLYSLTLNRTENYKTLPLLRRQKETITKYNLPKNEAKTFQKKQLCPIKIDNEFFILNINQSHKFSILSNSFMKNLKFHLKYYETNSFLQTFLLQNFDKKIFSLGTDFKKLKNYLKSDNKKKIENYFNEIYKFNHFLNTFPKPFIIQLDGILANSAIGAYGTLPFSFSNGKTIFHFNSINFNFIPHGGELFVLKSLPNELGSFLALTGGKLTTKDLLKYGFLKDLMDFEDDNIEILKKITKSDALFNKFDCYEPVYKEVLSKRKDTEEMISEFFIRSECENPKKVLFDLYYRKKIIEKANLKKSEENSEFILGDSKNRDQVRLENNHYWFDNYFLKELKNKKKKFSNTFLDLNLDKISSIFSKNSIDEIFEALEMDDSEFGVNVLAELRSKNKDVLEITLGMLRKARNLSYGECNQLEFNTMLQLVDNKKIQPIIFQNIQKNSENLKNENFENLKFEKNEKNFENEKIKINLNLKSENFDMNSNINDLAPIKYYYKEFSEAFLCYFNGVDLRNIDQYENYAALVKLGLFRWGIDYMNPTFDREKIKRKIFLFFRNEKKKEEKIEKTISLLESEKKKKIYFEERKIEILKFFENEDFDKELNDIVNCVFNDGFLENEKLIFSKNENFSNFLKSRLNKEIRDCFVRTRLSKKKNFENFENFGEKFLDEELPLEINSDRFSLSEKTKKKINFENLKKKYKTKIKLKEKKNNLENFIKGNFSKNDFEIEKKNLNEKKIFYNGNSILEKDEKKYIKKTDWEFNKNFAYYIYEKGIINSEKKFRENLIKNLKILYEKNCENLDEKKKDEFRKFLENEFFENYEIGTLAEFCEKSLYKIFDFKKKIKKNDFVDLNHLEKEDYEFVKNEKNFDNKKNFDEIEKNLDLEKIESINDIIFLQNTKNSEKTENSKNSEKNDFLENILNSDFLEKEQKKFFVEIKNLSEKNKFFENFLKMSENVYLSKLEKFSKNLKKKNSGIFKNYINKNLDLETQNLILPSVLYKILKEFLLSIKSIYFQIKLNSENNLESSKFEIISKILKNANFENLEKKENLEKIFEKLDFLVLKGLEIYKENSEKLIFEEDKMEKKMSDFVINIKNNLTKKNKILEITKEIEENNDFYKIANIENYQKYHLD